MQTTAIRTVANSLPQNEVILLTLLISKRYIPYTDLNKYGLFCAESYFFIDEKDLGTDQKRYIFPLLLLFG